LIKFAKGGIVMIIRITKIPDIPILESIPLLTRQAFIGLTLQARLGKTRYISADSREVVSKKIKGGDLGFNIRHINLFDALRERQSHPRSKKLYQAIQKLIPYDSNLQNFLLSTDEAETIDYDIQDYSSIKNGD